MEGLAQAAAVPVPFEWNGKEYLLGKFTLGEWAYLESAYVKFRRQQIIQQAKDLEEILSADEYADLYKSKLREAMAVKEASNEELQEFVWGPSKRDDETDDEFKERLTAHAGTEKFNKGIAFLMSTILNRRYPGEFKYTDVLRLIMNEAITGAHLEDFLGELQSLQGSEGNQDGEGTDQETPPASPQVSAPDSVSG